MRLSRQDVRLAVRTFARHPGFTVTAVLSLGLAIALNTTMYGVLDALIKPHVAVRDPDQIYSITIWGDPHLRANARQRNALLASGFHTYEALSFSGNAGRSAVEHGRRYAAATTMNVGPGLFSLLGVHALRGRLLDSADAGSASRPVVISDRLAATLSPDVPFPLGEAVLVDGVKRPVVGILDHRALFAADREADIFSLPDGPADAYQYDIVRLRPGVTLAQADDEFKLIAMRLAIVANLDPTLTRIQLKQINVSQFAPRRFHFALAAAVFAILLIACANLANLQLARGISRRRELALRTALGASRGDIVTQLLMESALLAAAGVLIGVLLTVWGAHIVGARIPPEIEDYIIEPQIGWRAFAFAAGIGALCILLVGLLPSVRVSRADPNELLKSGAGTGATRSHRRQYGILVAAELALALALLSGAAIVIRSAMRVHEVRIGYDPKPITIAEVVVRQTARDTVIRLDEWGSAMLSSLRAVPDLADAAFDVRRVSRWGVTVDERNGSPREIDAPMTNYDVVSPTYFRTIHLPIVAGRDFIDGATTDPEIIVDQKTARILWPGVSPLGQEIKLGLFASNAPWVRVVGVVRDVNDQRPMIASGQTWKTSRLGHIYYRPSTRDSVVLHAGTALFSSFLLRARTDPERMNATARRFLPSAGGPIFASDAGSLERALGLVQARMRHDFVASLFLAFSALALGLAALGIYGVVAHSVAERRRELGVRIALGASVRDVLHAVLREGAVVALAGVAVGLYLTKDTAGWLRAFIAEGDEYDAHIFAGMAVVLLIVAFVAALLPAIRATRIDPVDSLRCE